MVSDKVIVDGVVIGCEFVVNGEDGVDTSDVEIGLEKGGGAKELAKAVDEIPIVVTTGNVAEGDWDDKVLLCVEVVRVVPDETTKPEKHLIKCFNLPFH